MKKKFLIFATLTSIVFMSCSKDQMEEPQANQPEEFATAMSNSNRGGGSLINSPGKDLLGRFEFDGNLNDTTRQLAPGTAVFGKAVYTADRKGNKNRALRFDERYGVDIKGVALDSNMSISFWMKYDMQPGDYFINIVEGQHSFSFQHRENNRFHVSYWDFNTPTSILSNPLFNSWHHMAATRDNKTLKFYIDGKLVGSTSLITGGAPPYNIQEFWLGYCYNAGFRFWKGNLDDLRIYKRVITANEVNILATY